ncbi:sigma-70 family RNA polymerase sigma factor [Massilia sp. MB5]|uniref:sigma-70 family RNA polymerase sigma factor n=1 Tax=unclassified Massilia TaxID=2609279 RepID=UPI00067D6187|nr:MULTISPECIES: sigma-70 family RNA polymerase sigma factor [unclassified Massilia]AKU22442.1 RNA polymerase subunit sigma [Massilia sp. NR 4-1]UMR32775.1 sigma-70 family RNA polymerase sigma factor [Massilia sp. MB5]
MATATTLQLDPGVLYHEHHAWLFGWLRKKLGCAHHAADLAQDTFLRIVAARDTLPQLAEPRAWLTTTAKRLLIDRQRRALIDQAYIAELELLAQELPCYPSPEEILQAAQALNAIARVLEGLSNKAREAFLAHYLDGESHAAIAARLEVSTRMVHKYLVQALMRCGEALDEPCL